jgi:hypothetical protein
LSKCQHIADRYPNRSQGKRDAQLGTNLHGHNNRRGKSLKESDQQTSYLQDNDDHHRVAAKKFTISSGADPPLRCMALFWLFSRTRTRTQHRSTRTRLTR